MFVEGGVEIVTPGVARTFVQPDADVIHYVDRQVVDDVNPEERLKPHLDKLYEFLDSLRKSKLAFDWLFPAIAVIIWVWAAVEWYLGNKLSVDIIIQFALGLLPPFAKPGVIWVLRRFFHRKLGDLIGGSS